MLQAVYAVSVVKKSSKWDDVIFIQGNSGLIPTYSPLTRKSCSKFKQVMLVNLPESGNEGHRFETTLLKKLQESETETEKN